MRSICQDSQIPSPASQFTSPASQSASPVSQSTSPASHFTSIVSQSPSPPRSSLRPLPNYLARFSIYLLRFAVPFAASQSTSPAFPFVFEFLPATSPSARSQLTARLASHVRFENSGLTLPFLVIAASPRNAFACQTRSFSRPCDSRRGSRPTRPIRPSVWLLEPREDDFM